MIHILPTFQESIQHNRALATAQLLSEFGQPVTVLVADYLPMLRRDLQTNGGRFWQWSIFDELQQTAGRTLQPLQLADFNWPAQAQFLPNGNETLIYVAQKLYARVNVTQGAVTQIIYYDQAGEASVLHVDDRGFVGQIDQLVAGTRVQTDYLTPAGDVVASVNAQGKVTLAQLVDGQQVFANMQALQLTLLHRYLQQAQPEAILTSDLTLGEALADEHDIIALANTPVSWTDKTVTPFATDSAAGIWPFVLTEVMSESLMQPQAQLVWRVGDTSLTEAQALLDTLVQVAVGQGNMQVTILTDEAQLPALQAHLSERILAVQQQAHVLVEQTHHLAERFQWVTTDAAAVDLLRYARVVLAWDDTLDLMWTQAILQTGVPQIRRTPSPILVPGANGALVADMADLQTILPTYLNDVAVWQQAHAAAQAFGAQLNSEMLYAQWQEVLKGTAWD